MGKDLNPVESPPKEQSDELLVRWVAHLQAHWARWNIARRYRKKTKEKSDINEHLPILRELSRSCSSVCEIGVRRCVSSWAFLQGLAESEASKKKLLCIDINPADVSDLERWGGNLIPPVRTSMVVADSRKIVLPHEFDLLFIDTLHVYGQLKAELWAHQRRIRRFIVLHDTEIDGDKGEVLRMGWDTRKMAQNTGMKEEELLQGMGRAIREFLAEFPEWVEQSHFANNNGLTVLARAQK
jgi:Methyltransferase domain